MPYIEFARFVIVSQKSNSIVQTVLQLNDTNTACALLVLILLQLGYWFSLISNTPPYAHLSLSCIQFQIGLVLIDPSESAECANLETRRSCCKEANFMKEPLAFIFFSSHRHPLDLSSVATEHLSQSFSSLSRFSQVTRSRESRSRSFSHDSNIPTIRFDPPVDSVAASPYDVSPQRSPQ